MILHKSLSILCSSLFLCTSLSAQVYSFEGKDIPSEWGIDKGKVEIANQRKKLGEQSLKLIWKPNSIVTFTNTATLEQASKSRNGGLTTWIYNENPTNQSLVFSFLDKGDKEVCRLPLSMNFRGWRCVWSKFGDDMNLAPKTIIQKMRIIMPNTPSGGTIYLDHVEFTKNVSWQKMSDAQYKVNQKDFSLIHDFMGYRNTCADLSKTTFSKENTQAAQVVSDRLTQWYLGTGDYNQSSLVQIRTKAEKKFIQKGVREASKITIAYADDKIAIGNGLYPMYAPSKIDGQKTYTFMDINKNVLLPLALDYKKNNRVESLDKARFIYDWFNDQGWADGSGLGTLCFEKLRSSGYFHSFFLLKDQLTKEQLERELKTLNWLTMFGTCYQTPSHTGEVADNLRALALPKLIYALSLTGEKEKQTALMAFSSYMNNSLSIAPGYFGVIKSDFSGYHHRGAYNSAYYPHALYASSLIAYLLHDTPYALSQTSLDNLKKALLTFRFFSANLDVPAGTSGRFPDKRRVLQELLPAFSYVALSMKSADTELIAAYKHLVENNQKEIDELAENVNSSLSYTSSVGEAEMMICALQSDVKPEANPVGSIFMPYSGLLVVKNENHHFNIKGFSKYIWDFESSPDENIYGRYSSYGQIEHIDLKKDLRSFNPSMPSFNWNYIAGTTAKVLPLDVLGSKKFSHRNFTDETFLCGVTVSPQTAMFAFKMHDNTFDKSFRVNKSVFFIDGALLCLGSNIQNGDDKFNTVTTLFQSTIPNKGFKVEEGKNGSIVSDNSGMYYALKSDKIASIVTDSSCVAYINHGFAPINGKYQYYILPDKSAKDAQLLLSKNSPVQVLRQDSVAHIVRNKKSNTLYAAIFDAAAQFTSLPILKVNIPLSYILENRDNGNIKLSLCEPDMRRTSALSMGMLSEEEVVQQEQSFATQLTIKGNYKVEGAKNLLNVKYVDNSTVITISTIRGENYILNLIKK